MEKELLQNLNPEQQKAVLATEGPVLVLAGAGSGKTKALTHRIAYLIREKKVSPYNILAVTFTNKAAAEIKMRIAGLISASNVTLPWAGTFHSVCVRILRREADYIGYARSFTIADSNDQISIIKRIMRELEINPKNYNPTSIQYFISGAKNELINATEYKNYVNSPLEQNVSKVYDRYEKYLRQTNLMDFDDLIMNCVFLFQKNPSILEKYQKLFKYILIDEYQDTNQAQYVWVKLLAAKYKNIMVVGDDYQCVSGETKILVSDNLTERIKEIKRGDLITAASGWGKLHPDEVQRLVTTKYSGYLVHIKTKSGQSLVITPNHKMFANLQMQPGLFYVYLMFRADKGYRIGVTQGVRGRKGEIANGLMVRINQEQGDRIWLLESCRTLADALYFEQFYAFKYGIPTTIFTDASKKAIYSQDKIDLLYHQIPTEKRAHDLARDIDLDLDFPHHQPQAVIKNGKGRKIVNLVMFGENRSFEGRNWHAHRICLNTTDDKLREKLEGRYPVRSGQRGTWRVETSRRDYNTAIEYVDGLMENDDSLLLNQKARLLAEKSFNLMPAKNLRIGMLLPVVVGGKIAEDEVVNISKVDFQGELFDLDVANLHNFVANGIIVHNSIYSWRGANFRNILNFEKDYKNAVVIKLEQNYRSSKTILSAANDVIKFNKNKTDKKLWTENSDGLPITVYQALNEKDEAEFVAMEIKSLKSRGFDYSDAAILYRTNAQSRAIEETFLRFKIPYKIVGGFRFYERKEIKDIISYLRLIYNPADFESFERAVCAVPRGIGEKTIARIRDVILSMSLEAKNPIMRTEILRENTQDDRTKAIQEAGFPPKVVDFFKLLDGFETLSLTAPLDRLILEIAEKSGYKAFLLDGTAEGEGRWENILELSTVAAQVETQMPKSEFQMPNEMPNSPNTQNNDEEETALELFLQQVSLTQDTDQIESDGGVVTLMTLHSAKGLEFRAVFIVGVEEGLFPHSRAISDESEMEEERRLCYVGITRAKERLYLIHAGERNLYGRFQCNEVSRFIENIPEELLDII